MDKVKQTNGQSLDPGDPNKKVSTTNNNIDNIDSKDKVSGSSENLGRSNRQIPLTNFNILPEEILIEKSKKWRQFNTKRFSEKRKFGFVEGQKDKLPPEVLR